MGLCTFCTELLSDVEFRKKKSTFRERLEYFEKKYPGILGLQLPPSTKYFSNTDEDIEKAMDRDTFLEADEAMKFGIVDKVFETRPESETDGGEDKKD